MPALPSYEIATTDNGYPDGGGSRLIPDRTCVERDVLVGPGKTTSVWALYEKWSSEKALETATGETLALFPTAFGVFNPSRYGAGGATVARTLPLCRETAPDGDRANGVDCAAATAGGTLAEPFPSDDPRSPFDGTRRDFYIWGPSTTPPRTTPACRSSAATAPSAPTASTPRTEGIAPPTRFADPALCPAMRGLERAHGPTSSRHGPKARRNLRDGP